MSGTLEERVTAIEERLGMGLPIAQSQHGELLRKQSEAIEQLKRDHGAKLDQIIGMLGQLLDQDETKPG